MLQLSLTLLLAFSLRLGAGIKSHRVTVESGSLSTSRHTEIVCDYLLWKQEELYSVTWALQYPGVKTDFLEYKNDGSKKFPSNTIVGVDRSFADEKRVRIKVSEDFDESELTICCEVKVLRDSGYGSTKTMMKEKCSTFDVMEEPATPVELDLWLSHTEAVDSDLVDITCSSRDSHSSQLEYVILVNGREIPGEMRSEELKARLELTEDHFGGRRRQVGWGSGRNPRRREVTVECQAKVGGRMMGNTSRTILRSTVRGGRVLDSNSSRFSVKRNNAGTVSQSHILVEAKHSSGSVIVGQLSRNIRERLQNSRTSHSSRLETSEEPVEILNILGSFGYSVVAMANTADSRIIWTLASKSLNEVNDEL